jgi:transcriptional regulator with XRE-family HTH domain
MSDVRNASFAELGDFLRARRGRLRPEDAGVVRVGGRRRVPGLRREEVAGLAGVSVDYYVRLEQGRGQNASDAVLEAVARALRLDPAEQAHLWTLARPPRAGTPGQAAAGGAAHVAGAWAPPGPAGAAGPPGPAGLPGATGSGGPGAGPAGAEGPPGSAETARPGAGVSGAAGVAGATGSAGSAGTGEHTGTWIAGSNAAGGEAAGTRGAGSAALRDGVRVLLDLITAPAFVLGPRMDVVAWNGPADALLGFSALPPAARNMARQAFLDPAARDTYPEWETVAAETVAHLRLDAARRPGDPAMAALIAELSAGNADFARLWAEHRVATKAYGGKVLRTPASGTRRIGYETLALPGDPGHLIVVYTPPARGTDAVGEGVGR